MMVLRIGDGQGDGNPDAFNRSAYQLFSVAQANGLDGFEATGIAHYVYEVLSGRQRRDPKGASRTQDG